MISAEMANSESSNGEIPDGANKTTVLLVGNSVPYNKYPELPGIDSLNVGS